MIKNDKSYFISSIGLFGKFVRFFVLQYYKLQKCGRRAEFLTLENTQKPTFFGPIRFFSISFFKSHMNTFGTNDYVITMYKIFQFFFSSSVIYIFRKDLQK